MGADFPLGLANAGSAKPAPAPASLDHQICNLVQAVNGYIELAARRTQDEDTLRFLANARAAADQLIEVCRQLPPEQG